MNATSFSSFTELYSKSYEKELFEQWKFFLHISSVKHRKPHDKFKFIGEVLFMKDEIWFFPVTTDKYNSKESKIRKREAIIINQGEVRCLHKKSIVDVNDLEVLNLSRAKELYRESKTKGNFEKLIDQHNKLPEKYREELKKACMKANPPKDTYLLMLRSIAGEQTIRDIGVFNEYR